MKKDIWKSRCKALAFTIAPFGIPLISSLIPNSIINEFGKAVIMLLLFIIDTYWVMKITVRDDKQLDDAKEIINTDKKYRTSIKILNRIANCEKIKCGFIKDETYKPHYDYKENILLYSPHRYLERVCDEIKSLISEITHIDLEYISVSFIYKYPKYTENNCEDEYDKWRGWKWITGKDSTANHELNELVNKNNSYFHYLIANDKITSFENDKYKLIPEGNYYVGEKDKRHNMVGSISAHKMSFHNNNSMFCIGYLIISTYGKKFYDIEEKSEFESEFEFQEVLFEHIIPPFRKIIETELGLLFMRHIERKKLCKKQKNK